ncbi:MAG: hypothetical protein ACK5HZ_04780 [Macellibacteroides fermentans]|uniref:hypothetical protein n=1 Tax=Macellibacteroides fermentans TaxID=879969 RepID=UPI003AC722E4
MIDIYLGFFYPIFEPFTDWIIQSFISIISSIIGAFLGYFFAMRIERKKRIEEKNHNIENKVNLALNSVKYFNILLNKTTVYLTKQLKNIEEFNNAYTERPCEVKYMKRIASSSLISLYEYPKKEMYDAIYVLNNLSSIKLNIIDDEFNRLIEKIDFIYHTIIEIQTMVEKNHLFAYEKQKSIQTDINNLIVSIDSISGRLDDRQRTEILNLLNAPCLSPGNTNRDFLKITNQFLHPLLNYINELKQENKISQNDFEKLFYKIKDSLTLINDLKINSLELVSDINRYAIKINEFQPNISDFSNKLNMRLAKKGGS